MSIMDTDDIYDGKPDAVKRHANGVQDDGEETGEED